MLTKEQIEVYTEVSNALLDLCCNLAEDGTGCLKYHLGLKEQSEHYPLYTEDIATLFDWLYNNCKEYITAYEYYNGKRQPLPNNPELPALDLDG